jgi:hypothetical protein
MQDTARYYMLADQQTQPDPYLPWPRAGCLSRCDPVGFVNAYRIRTRSKPTAAAIRDSGNGWSSLTERDSQTGRVPSFHKRTRQPGREVVSACESASGRAGATSNNTQQPNLQTPTHCLCSGRWAARRSLCYGRILCCRYKVRGRRLRAWKSSHTFQVSLSFSCG